MRDKPTLSSARGKLYSNFLTWMRAQYGGEPTATEWSHIIDEDERVCWDSSQPAVYDPESQDPVDPYKIECPPSQSDGSESLFNDSISSSQETRLPEGGLSPPIL